MNCVLNENLRFALVGEAEASHPSDLLVADFYEMVRALLQ